MKDNTGDMTEGQEIAAPLLRLPSVVVTLIALLMFGYIRRMFITAGLFRRAGQTVVVGGMAATAAFMIAKGSVAASRKQPLQIETGTNEWRRKQEFGLTISRPSWS